MCVCVCVCEREREKELCESVCVCVSMLHVCVCEREIESCSVLPAMYSCKWLANSGPQSDSVGEGERESESE